MCCSMFRTLKIQKSDVLEKVFVILPTTVSQTSLSLSLSSSLSDVSKVMRHATRLLGRSASRARSISDPLLKGVKCETKPL